MRTRRKVKRAGKGFDLLAKAKAGAEEVRIVDEEIEAMAEIMKLRDESFEKKKVAGDGGGNEIVYHGTGNLNNIKIMIQEGSVSSPAKIRDGKDEIGDFYEDLVKDMGPEALANYQRKYIDIEAYLDENGGRLYKNGSEGTKKVMDNWKVYRNGGIPSSLDGESLFRESGVWISSDESDSIDTYGEGGGYFEFNAPKKELSFEKDMEGDKADWGISPGSLSLKNATKLKISDGSRIQEFESLLSENGLGHIKVESVTPIQ